MFGVNLPVCVVTAGSNEQIEH